MKAVILFLLMVLVSVVIAIGQSGNLVEVSETGKPAQLRSWDKNWMGP